MLFICSCSIPIVDATELAHVRQRQDALLHEQQQVDEDPPDDDTSAERHLDDDGDTSVEVHLEHPSYFGVAILSVLSVLTVLTVVLMIFLVCILMFVCQKDFHSSFVSSLGSALFPP